MKLQRLVGAVLAVALMTGISQAQEAHSHADDSHDHDAMAKKEEGIAKALAALSAEDQKLAKAQRFCPMMTYDRLGAMGTPLKLMIEGKPVFVCCKACVEDANKGGAKTVLTVTKLRESTEVLAKLPMNERMAIEAQKYCAVANTSFLGSMGNPLKMIVNGKPVYLCCDSCTAKAKSDPLGTLAKAEELIKAGTVQGHDHADAGHEHADHDHAGH